MENKLRHCCAQESQISIRQIKFAEEVSDPFSRNVRDLALPTGDPGSLRQAVLFCRRRKGKVRASLQLVKASEGKAGT